MVFEFTVKDGLGNPVPGMAVSINNRNNGSSFVGYSDGNGLINVNDYGHAQAGDLLVLAVNGADIQGRTGNIPYPGQPYYFVPSEAPVQALELYIQLFKSPTNWTEDQLCAVRGAMWTARLNLPLGPRPGQDSNILALDYLESYDVADQDRALVAYRGAGYTHCVDGPLLDAGYHDQFPAVDYRGMPAAWWALMRKKWAAGLCPIHFMYPDQYGFSDNDLSRFMADFEPIYRSREAQALCRMVVPYGWERGYEVTNAQWVRLLRWTREVLPNALVCIHLPADQDAPTGRDDDHIPGWTNGRAWQAVAPYTHLWLVQNGGYINGGHEQASVEFQRNFAAQFNPHVRGSLANRFSTGYPGDWAQGSAFGPNVPIRLVAGEYASFADYWWNWPEAEAKRLGDLAIVNGAWGSLDGCFA